MANPVGVLADGTKVLAGRGALYFDRLGADGTKQGERFLGNVSAFELSMSEDTIQKYSSVDAAGAVLSQTPMHRKMEWAATLNEFEQNNLALALVGTPLTEAQTGASVTNEIVTVKQKGVWYKFAKRKISNSPQPVITGPSATPTYVLGTDYEIDYDTGRIFIKTGGSIPASGNLECDYTYSTESLLAVGAGNAGVKGYLRFIGDPAAGPIVEVEVWNSIISPDSTVGLIGDDYAEFRVKGLIIPDVTGHPTSPYYTIRTR